MELQKHELEHIAKIRGLAADCTLFLKKDGAFPLEGPCPIYAIGSGVRHTIKGGTGGGEVNSHFYTTIEEGLESAGFTLTSSAWLDAYDEIRHQQEQARDARIRENLKKEMKIFGLFVETGKHDPEPEFTLSLEPEGDAAIYVLSRNSGEGYDRSAEKGDFKLTDNEIREIRALAARFSKFMLVLNVGGAIDLTEILDDVPNILLLSQLGVVTGDILADILLGKTNPSGKLTTTWAPIEAYPTTENFGGHDETDYREGIYVGYRYFETVGKKPLFPFGHGLSYTDFALSPAGFTLNGNTVCVDVKVRNIGSFSGKEVMQLYVTKPEGVLPEPFVSLAAFQKTTLLAPGQEETVCLTISIEDLASYDEAASAYILQAGDFVFRLGNSCENLQPCGIVRIRQTLTVKKVKHIGGKPDFADAIYARFGDAECLDASLPVLLLDADAICTQTVCYDLQRTHEPFLESLSDQELATLVLGHYDDPGAPGAMMGNPGGTVGGGVGETTRRLKKQGIDESLVMSDGPAGLHLFMEYGRDEYGTFPFEDYGGGFITLVKKYMSEEIIEALGYGKQFEARKQRVEKQYQYCTAIPIGTAIAQSFDPTLAQALGDLMGTEMELFGVHLWLAPGMNLHRSPLCGRDFEYFSEDPLVIGKMAAAITRGVQAHKGCGTTPKHFCCNNQEYRRLYNSSNVSERALRELYVKGFEIVIRESQPKALMSSYNLVNGVHTSERYDLMTDYLRCEAGFRGLIMTDWVGTNYDPGDGKYRNGCAAPTMKAGNDLFMSGNANDYADLLRALSEGELTRDDLLRNAESVYRTIRALNAQRKSNSQPEPI